MDKIEIYRELERRGQIDSLPPEKLAIYNELKSRGVFGNQIETQEEVEEVSGRGIAAKTSRRERRKFDDYIRGQIPAFEGDIESLQEIGAAPELNRLDAESLKSALAANLIASDFELTGALKQQYPDIEFSRDEDLNIIANMPSGESYYLSAPGS